MGNSSPGACPTKYRIDQIRSNSNFAWNSYRCAFEDCRPIITKFGTRHDSRTVVTCTKFRYDRPIIIEIRGTRIFSKFWILVSQMISYFRVWAICLITKDPFTKGLWCDNHNLVKIHVTLTSKSIVRSGHISVRAMTAQRSWCASLWSDWTKNRNFVEDFKYGLQNPLYYWSHNSPIRD